MEQTIIERLIGIEQKLDALNSLQTSAREVLTFEQARVYLDVSASHLYKLTSQGRIPHSKPNGKRVYFERKELEAWLLQNKIATTDEIDRESSNRAIFGTRRRVR